MRYLSVWVMAACLAFPALGESLPDSPEARRKEADRYLEVMDAVKMMRDMAEEMAKTLPEDKRADFKNLMTKHVRVEVLSEAMIAAMVKNFTTQELKALADFYGSVEGRSAMAKFATYMAEVMPAIQAEMSRAVAESRAEQAKSGT